MPHWKTVKSTTLFAEKVIPQLRRKQPDLSAGRITNGQFQEAAE